MEVHRHHLQSYKNVMPSLYLRTAKRRLRQDPGTSYLIRWNTSHIKYNFLNLDKHIFKVRDQRKAMYIIV
jgi:hypothetical protein